MFSTHPNVHNMVFVMYRVISELTRSIQFLAIFLPIVYFCNYYHKKQMKDVGIPPARAPTMLCIWVKTDIDAVDPKFLQNLLALASFMVL